MVKLGKTDTTLRQELLKGMCMINNELIKNTVEAKLMKSICDYLEIELKKVYREQIKEVTFDNDELVVIKSYMRLKIKKTLIDEICKCSTEAEAKIKLLNYFVSAFAIQRYHVPEMLEETV
jgi:hypothetical protein